MTERSEGQGEGGKSNLIFTMVATDGLLKIPADATGLSAGERGEVILV